MPFTIKELAKLTKACRKLGIKTFKSNEFEFTLTESEPVKMSKRQVKEAAKIIQDTKISTYDELSDEELLFYSSGDFQAPESDVLTKGSE